VLSKEGVETIHRASMRLLKELGILIIDYPPALETMRAHGAQVEDDRVRIDEDTLMHHVHQAPSTFTQLARNPDNHLPIGGRHTVFAPVYGPPFVGDLDSGRRKATLQDFQNFALINVSSPLRYDDRMLGSLEVYARARQGVIVTPFIIAGAMSPASLAGTLAQQNAEALFGIGYAQMLNPGTPCVYGSFTANVDMKSGAPCFGTPENALALYAGAQLARHYNLPYRSGGNFTASRVPDAQAGYESAGTMWPTLQAGTNFVLHAAGWLEGGLIAGYEKFVLDLEICGMLARFVEGISLTEEELAWDAFEEVGPGGHFLGAQHTMRRYSTAFYQHTIFSMDNYEKWEEEGSPDTYRLANAAWKRMLKAYERPALDQAILEELNAFAEQRRDAIRAGKPRTE
jgi:trimethylamine--corrinoid protein Co-methyltransferase